MMSSGNLRGRANCIELHAQDLRTPGPGKRDDEEANEESGRALVIAEALAPPHRCV
jgi:hypothetical protein